MIHHHALRCLEPINQQTAGIVCRIVDRAHHFCPAAAEQPAGGGIQKAIRGLLVVEAFEHAKATHICALVPVVVGIVAHKYAADAGLTAIRHKLRCLPVQIKRMLAAIEKRFDLQQKRRCPVRVASVDLPRKPDELVKLAGKSPRELASHRQCDGCLGRRTGPTVVPLRFPQTPCH